MKDKKVKFIPLTTVVEKVGDEYFIPIPDEILEKLGIEEGDKCDVEFKDGEILITKIKA